MKRKKTKRKAWKKPTPTQLPDQLCMGIRGARTTALDHRLVALVLVGDFQKTMKVVGDSTTAYT